MLSAMTYCCGVKARALCSPGIVGGVSTGGRVCTMRSGVEADVAVDVGQVGDVRGLVRRRVVVRGS